MSDRNPDHAVAMKHLTLFRYLSALALAFAGYVAPWLRRPGRHFFLEAGDGPGVTRVLSSQIELAEGVRQSWQTITRTGSFTDPRYGRFEITRQMLLQMVANFEAGVVGQDVFIDVAHRPGDGAAAKVLKLMVDRDRLRGLMEWTPYGIESVRERGYAYLSAEFHDNWQDNEQGKAHGCVLLGAGLTTRPVIKRLDPVQLSEALGEDTRFAIHPSLLKHLESEMNPIEQLRIFLLSLGLTEAHIAPLIAEATKQLSAAGEEAAKQLAVVDTFKSAGKTLSEQIKTLGGAPAQINLSVPALAGLDDAAVASAVAKALAQRDADAAAASTALAEIAARMRLLADAALLAECPGEWSASDIGEGVCYSIFTYDLNLQEFQGGPMQPRARIKGKKLYDPRTGLTAWSRNNALAALDYVRAPYGKAALETQVAQASFAAGATVCDELVDFSFLAGLDSGGDPIRAPRYVIDGVVRTNVNPDQVLDQLCQSMATTMTRSGGLWTLQPGVYTAPVMTLGDADCMGAIEAVAGEEGHEVLNGMRGQFFDPARYGELTDYRSHQIAAYRAEDGEDLWGDLSLPFTMDHWRCMHLAGILTERSRGETLVFPAKRRGLRLRAGQRVVLNNSQLNIQGVVYRVVKREWRLGGPVMLTLQQDAPEIWDIYPALASLPPTSTPSDDPWVVAPVQGLALSSGTATLVRLADGTVLGRIRLAYAAASSALVVASGELQVETRRASSASDAWLRHPSAAGSSTEHFLLGLEEGVVYLVRARWVNGLGARSDWATAAVEHVGKLEHPAAFGALAATVIPGAVRVLRSPEPEVDWAYSTFEYTINGGATWLPIRDPAGRDGVTWLNPPVGTVQVRGWDVDSSGLRGNPLATDPFVVSASDLYPSSSTLGIKVNVGDFAGNQNWSEAYIHGITGGVAADAPGSILVNGVARSVPAGVLFTNRGPVDAWIVWDMTGAFDFSAVSAGTTRPYAMCRRTSAGWQYDNNSSDWVAFTPGASHVVIGSISTGGPDDRGAYLTGGHYGVIPWDGSAGAVSAAACHDNGRWSVADPRLPNATEQLVAVIRAEDGTWHRPFTTLELAALQSLVDPDEQLELDGLSDQAWRERIGNAVPPAAAQAIASEMGRTLLLAWSGETFQLNAAPVWVRPALAALMVAQGDAA